MIRTLVKFNSPALNRARAFSLLQILFSQSRDQLFPIPLKIHLVAFCLIAGKYPNVRMSHFITDDPAQDPFIVKGLLLCPSDLAHDFEKSGKSVVNFPTRFVPPASQN